MLKVLSPQSPPRHRFCCRRSVSECTWASWPEKFNMPFATATFVHVPTSGLNRSCLQSVVTSQEQKRDHGSVTSSLGTIFQIPETGVGVFLTSTLRNVFCRPRCYLPQIFHPNNPNSTKVLHRLHPIWSYQLLAIPKNNMAYPDESLTWTKVFAPQSALVGLQGHSEALS